MAAFLNRSAFSKQLAHTTMLQALGNQDLKLLQDLITAQKFVIASSQKLSDDWAKGSEALKTWGTGEGDDLTDILDKSRVLLGAVSDAFSQLSAHETTIRVHMKEIRAREESLNELQRTRKQLGTKIEAAEKKLSKMNPGHKQLQTQQDVLNQLREEGRQLDDSILAEEASLGDYKRQTTKDMMSVKFGGLCELAEKVMIVGNAGKQLIESIPLEETKPGAHRAPYLARARTTDLLASTGLRIAQVTFQSTHSDFAHRNEPGAAPPQQEPFEKFAEPHTLSEFPGGLSPPRPAFLHARASTTAGEKDSNATSSPHLRSRSLSLPDGFDPDFSPVIQPRASVSTFSQLSRPSSMFVSQPGRRPDSMFSDPGTDPASGRLGLSEMTDQMLRSSTPTPGRRPDSQAVGFHSIAEEPGRTDGQQAFQPPQSGTAEGTLTDQLQIPHIPPPAYSPSDQQTFSPNDTQQQGEASPGQSGSLAPNPSQPPPSLSSSSSGGDRKSGFLWMR